MKKVIVAFTLMLCVSLMSFGQIAKIGGEPEKVETAKEIGESRMLKLHASGGWFYMTGTLPAGIDEGMKDYMNGLRSGFVYNVDGALFINHKWGIGVKYSSAKSDNSTRITVYDYDNKTHQSGRMTDDINRTFLGLSIVERYVSEKGHITYGTVSFGKITYTNNSYLFGNWDMVGTTFGMCGDLGVDFCLGSNVYAGFALTYYLGGIEEVTINGEPVRLESRESMCRLEGSVGVALYF